VSNAARFGKRVQLARASPNHVGNLINSESDLSDRSRLVAETHAHRAAHRAFGLRDCDRTTAFANLVHFDREYFVQLRQLLGVVSIASFSLGILVIALVLFT